MSDHISHCLCVLIVALLQNRLIHVISWQIVIFVTQTINRSLIEQAVYNRCNRRLSAKWMKEHTLRDVPRGYKRHRKRGLRL